MARLRLGVLATLMGATLTACDDTTGPGIFDPEMTAAAMADMSSASEGLGDAWAGLSLAGSLFEGSAAAELLPNGGQVLMDPASSQRFASHLSAAAFFPSNYIGQTFVWHAGEQAYIQADVPEDGTPEDGIRVIYYAVNPATGRPANPLNRLGYIDLRDLSSPSSDRLGVKVENEAGTAATLADYWIDVSYTSTQEELAVTQRSEGYLSNGAARLNFDLRQTATISETEIVVDQDFEMSLGGTDVRLAWGANVASDWAGENPSVSIDATVAGFGTSVQFVVDAEGEVIAGEVLHGSTLVATISGSPEHPVFTNVATGEELTPAQLEALADIFGALEGLMELAEGIFEPVGGE